MDSRVREEALTGAVVHHCQRRWHNLDNVYRDAVSVLPFFHFDLL